MDSLVCADEFSAGAKPVPLVSLSADYYATGPLIPGLRRRWRIVVIVETTRLRRDEVACFPALAVGQHPDRIDLRAVSVIGMWIGRHVVPARILIREQHACADWNRELLGTHAARCQRESVRVRGIRRWWSIAAAAARREEQTEDEDKECHVRQLSETCGLDGNVPGMNGGNGATSPQS
jgi:hypothetical protein